MAIDFSGFEFGVTIHQGMNWDNLRLPQRFASIVDGKEPHHVLLRMYSGAAGLCSAEVMFDGEGQMLLHNEWRRVARSHTIEVSHFFVLKYNGHNIFTVKVFDETICRRHLGNFLCNRFAQTLNQMDQLLGVLSGQPDQH
ncbi:B3 domain-containing protein Os03g0212300-like [Lolium perenne]|uniref:B3 domain-containing protein Os03g0212300-like n=1 Tax=Lolium perenne TaxID=4522 RepID=UPI0021F5E82D|nr:B3 domain-containing protein Os03g0212300-like [Lolium perenne]